MFEYIYGKVDSVTNDKIVVDVNGVGFQIHVPGNVLNNVVVGDNSKIYLKLHVREDRMQLFGFLNLQERELFEKLQNISGIGPALALNILSFDTIQALYDAITQEKLSFFKKVKGVGPKMAKRIVLELKGSLKEMDVASISSIAGSFKNDAIKALTGLGYQEESSVNAVTEVLAQNPDIKNLEELVCDALKKI